jgi:replicative DNA helicase
VTDLWDAPPTDEPATGGRFERPCDDEAELVVLGSIMQRPDLIDDLAGVLDPADFNDQRRAWIWQAVAALRDEIKGGAIAWHAVDRQLKAWRASGQMPVIPLDEPTLMRIYDSAAVASAEYHAERVADAAAARRMVDLGIRAQQAGMNPAFDPGAAIPAVQADLDGVVREEARHKATALAELLPAVYEQAVTPRTYDDRVPTGLTDLDGATGGWAPGQLITIGARPGVGKTTVGLGFARAAAIRYGLPTLFASLEMSEEEIGQSIVAAEATVPLHHIKQGTATAADQQKMAAARERLAASPLRIDDSTQIGLAHLRHQVRTLVRAEGLRLLVVDYLQLMQSPRAENRQVAVAALARGLKLLAKEFRIPVIMLSQLNRGSEQRADKRPTSSDLRESGAVEQDSDIVLLLHRDDLREPESARAGELDLIIDKHRGGPRCTITAAAQLHYSRAVDMAGGF